MKKIQPLLFHEKESLNSGNSKWANPRVPGKLRLTHNEGSLELFLLASSDPRINDLLVKSPDSADSNGRDFTGLG